jgi:hypothetical protein
MTFYLNKGRATQGGVLVVTLGITVILGLGLASYLTLMRVQYVSVVRSQAWNAAMGLAEAGVEEALAQLNPGALLFSTNIDRGANGWSLAADGLYHAPQRAITNSSVTNGYYDVAISADPLPIIYSTGYVTIPTLSTTVARSVRVNTETTTVFRGSMAARTDVDLKGNNVATDSFDSMDPNKSTGGLYDITKRQAAGDIATASGLLNVQNANVMGTLYTGPAGSSSIGANGSVGDVAWVSAKTAGIEAGHYKNDFNMDFPPVLPPFTTAIAPASGTVLGTNYTWVMGSGNYQCDDSKAAKFGSGDVILVTGQAKLYVTCDFIMGGQSKLVIAPGASLQLYVGGANASISSVNNAGNCGTFTYFGLPSNTSLQLGGNDVFLGTVYAPSTDMKLSGGGSFNLDYQGAIAVNSIQMNGSFNFHFDENLRRKGPVRGYHVGSWSEN